MDEKVTDNESQWLEFCKKERSTLKQAGTACGPEPNFRFLITTLSLQASILLGKIPNPATSAFEENFTQAKLIIDTLGILKAKTKGNLTSEEEGHLDMVLGELRRLYMEPRQSSGTDFT